MNHIVKGLFCLLLGIQFVSAAEPRIVTTSNVLTEIVVALGHKDHLVGIDTTSHTTPALKKIPDIGYRLNLSAEGILSLKPTLILFTDNSGSKATIDHIKSTGVEHYFAKETSSVEIIKQTAEEVACLLDQCDQGKVLSAAVEKDTAALAAKIQGQSQRLSAMFVMHEKGEDSMGSFSGRGTIADQLMTAMGLTNTFHDDFTSYKKVDLESQLRKKADVLLIGKRANFGKEQPMVIVRSAKSLNIPENFAPKCIYEIDTTRFLVFGIHFMKYAQTLYDELQPCLMGEAS